MDAYLSKSLKRFIVAVMMLLTVLVIGITGYMLIERFIFLDALYQTIISVFAAGSREINPLSTNGRIFTIVIIVTGVSSLFFALGSGIEVMVEGHIEVLRGKGKLMRQIKSLKNHYIICGFGRVGQQVAEELRRTGNELVVIEDRTMNAEKALEMGFLCIRGEATEDELLTAAGIERAKGLISALSSDPKNVLVTLSSRQMNPNLYIVARGEDENSLKKLELAGADKAVSPYSLGGKRMAVMMVRPLVTQYIDTVVHGEEVELRMEEFLIPRSSPLVGQSLRNAHIRDETGALVLAIHKSGKLETNPDPETVIQDGDVLLAIGTSKQVDALTDLAGLKKTGRG